MPGHKAPILITGEMLTGMAPGSVIVDLAAERGGNCELTRPGETIIHEGITLLGPLNVPSMVPQHASQMFSSNIAAFVKLLVRDGNVTIDREDEIIRETLVTHEGQVVHPRVLELVRINGESVNKYEIAVWVFMLAAFLGFELIRRVSPLLHTPLMSLTNAISAIAVVGAILITGAKDASPLSKVLGFIAVVASTVNLVSGYLITDRMLKMFKKRGRRERNDRNGLSDPLHSGGGRLHSRDQMDEFCPRRRGAAWWRAKWECCWQWWAHCCATRLSTMNGF